MSERIVQIGTREDNRLTNYIYIQVYTPCNYSFSPHLPHSPDRGGRRGDTTAGFNMGLCQLRRYQTARIISGLSILVQFLKTMQVFLCLLLYHLPSPRLRHVKRLFLGNLSDNIKCFSSVEDLHTMGYFNCRIGDRKPVDKTPCGP